MNSLEASAVTSLSMPKRTNSGLDRRWLSFDDSFGIHIAPDNLINIGQRCQTALTVLIGQPDEIADCLETSTCQCYYRINL